MFDELGMNLQSLADWLGVRPISLLALTMLAMGTCNIVGRLIPDSATGWLGVARKFCKIMGLFIQNRVLPGVSVGDMAMYAHGTAVRANAVANVAAEAQGIEVITPPPPPIPVAEAELAGRMALGATNAITAPNGFVELRFLIILTFCLSVTLVLTACTPGQIQSASSAAQAVCKDREAAQLLFDSVAAHPENADKVFAFLRLTCPLVLPPAARN